MFSSRFDPGRLPKATVSLDLVIFDDGGYMGPDRAGTIALEKAKANAEIQMLAKLADHSTPDDQIITWLTGL